MSQDRQSRWSEIRLIVQRPQGGHCTYAVLHRRVEGGQRRDTLLCRGVLPCAPGSALSQDALEALGAAANAAYERLRGGLPPQAAGAPQGLQGGLQDPLPGLDSSSTL